jgi:hypothetical protein
MNNAVVRYHYFVNKSVNSFIMKDYDKNRGNINTLRTGDANLRFLRFCITAVKDEWCKSAFLTRAGFPRTSLHNTWSVSPNGPPGRMFKETWPHSELMIYDKYRGKKYRPQCVKITAPTCAIISCMSWTILWKCGKGLVCMAQRWDIKLFAILWCSSEGEDHASKEWFENCIWSQKI